MISRLILVHPDPQLRESLRYGFEREGIHVTLGADAVDASLFAQPAELVVAGGRSGDEARAILARIRDAMAASGAAPSDATPVLYVGNGIGRTQAPENLRHLGQRRAGAGQRLASVHHDHPRRVAVGGRNDAPFP